MAFWSRNRVKATNSGWRVYLGSNFNKYPEISVALDTDCEFKTLPLNRKHTQTVSTCQKAKNASNEGKKPTETTPHRLVHRGKVPGWIELITYLSQSSTRRVV